MASDYPPKDGHKLTSPAAQIATLSATIEKHIAPLALPTFGFFAVPVILWTFAGALDRLRRDEGVDLIALAIGYAFGFLPWLALSPAVFLVSRMSALARKTAFQIAIEIAALVVLCAAIILAYIYVVYAPALGLEGGELLRRVQVMQWTFDFFVFGLCFLAGRADGERTLKESVARERTELAVRLMCLEQERATLEANELRSRFSSHFMLNAFNNVLGLVRAGKGIDAERAVLALSEILKRVARAGRSSQSTLEEELEFLNSYLTFQRIRYPQIDVDIEVPEDVRAATVPAFLLQPLIENAFKHGLAPGGLLGAILRIWRDGNRVRLTFANSLPASKSEAGADGEGIALTRARLKLCYGADGSLSRAIEGAEHVVRLDLPWKPQTP